MVESETFLKDTFAYLKNDLIANISDPLVNSRPADSKFILTSYPTRKAVYPLITLKMINIIGRRAGMQTTAIDMGLELEVRVWGRNTAERDSIVTDIINRLKNIQFLTTGTAVAGLHDFNVLSAVEINEDGENTPKSKLITVSYRYYNPT